jgi:hypothetical protein
MKHRKVRLHRDGSGLCVSVDGEMIATETQHGWRCAAHWNVRWSHSGKFLSIEHQGVRLL